MIDLTAPTMTTGEWIGVGTAFMQFGALVWGAAKISSTVDQVKTDVGRIRDSLETISETQGEHHADIAVLKTKAGIYSK